MDNRKSLPNISIITIVKNNVELLPRAIESVLKQTLVNYEYIIVNDGSTDGTGEIIASYAENEERIKSIHHHHNSGRSISRNTGLQSAEGEYIFFLDSDDYLPETSLSDLYEVARENDADIVYGGIKAFEQVTGKWLPQYYTDSIIKTERHRFRLTQYPELVRNHQIVGRLFKLVFLRENDIQFSTARRNAEDVHFAFFTAFYARNISMIPEKTVYFYNYGNQLESANENKLADARDNVLEILNFAMQSGTHTIKKAMRRKGALFAGNLYRAQKVYQGNENKFKEYLQTLVPLLEFVTDEVLADLPPYCQKFTRALRAEDIDYAYHLWQQEYISTHLREKIEKVRSKNEKLTHKLDSIYSSSSWRITAPLRSLLQTMHKNDNHIHG